MKEFLAKLKAIAQSSQVRSAGRLTGKAGRLTGKMARKTARWARRVGIGLVAPGGLATRLAGNRFTLAGMVVIALIASYGAAAFSRPGDPEPERGSRVPVQLSVAACPAPSGARVSALTLPGSGTGRAELKETRWGRGGPVAASLTTPGGLWYTDVKDATGSWTVRATGGLAAGLRTEQTSTTEGLAGLRCAAPGVEHWFLGPGPAETKDMELYLANVDDQNASADVEVLSGDGQVDAALGTTVDPHESRVVPLGSELKSAKVLALRVRTTSGRVAAAVRVRTGDDKGAEWLPRATPPGKDLVIPGIPGGDGDRELLVAVAGEADANVKVSAITPDGTFAPEGQESLTAPARAVSPVTLSRALNGKPAAIRITSDQPVVAGFVARVRPEGGQQDLAIGAATPALTDAGVVASNRTRSGMESRLILTAPSRGAAVRITTIGGAGQPGVSQDVTVSGGRTAEVRLQAPPGAENGFGLVVTPRPGSGPIYAARVLAGKEAGLTVLPITPARVYSPAPPVANSVRSLWQ